MAVAFDAKMTAGNGGTGSNTLQGSGTSVTGTPITVGASATLLVVVAHIGNNPNSNPTATWNGTAMTLAATIENGTSNRSAIFTLVSPASGAKTLTVSWTGSTDIYCGAVSFTGTDTSTGINATDTVSGTTGTTVTVTSTTDGATVAVWGGQGGTPTTNFNTVFDDSALAPGAAGTYQLGGTSNGHTFTSGGGTQAWAGVHVIAASGGGGGFTAKFRKTLSPTGNHVGGRQRHWQ